MPSIDKKSVDTTFLPFVADTSDLEPLTPPDTDIRAVPWFKLDMLKLGHSEFLQIANNEELGAAVKLWMFAIHQVPAGSLPNNEVVLAQAAGYDHRKKAWQRVRGMALYGWALCSDGRLYHQTVAMTVLDILQSLQGRQSGGDDAMERLREQNRRRQQRFKEKQRESQMRRAGDSEAPEVREGTPASAAPVTAAVTLADSAGITLPITLSNKELDKDKDKDKEKQYDNNAQVTLQESLPVTLPNGGLPAAPEGFQVGQQDTISTREGLVCKRLRELGVRAAPHMVVVQEMCA
ncbi:MAG: hypothetical protein ACYCY2_09560, partial [Acidithiobacillus ferriphilus]